MVLAGVLLAGLVAPVASRAALSWSTPIALDRASQLSITSAACPSSTVCVAFDTAGRETTFDPQSPGSRVSASLFDGNTSFGLNYPVGLACPSASQCTAVTMDGQEATFDPADADALTRDTIDRAGLVSVACPATDQCTALDIAGDVVTFNPTAPGSPVTFDVDRDADPETIACTSITSCAIYDSSGSLWAFNPQEPTSAYQSISPAGEITGLTCLSSGLCLYASGGDVVTFEPADAADTTSTPVDPNALTGLACVSATQCTAVDGKGDEVTFNPTSPGSPSATAVDGIAEPSVLACATATQCTEFDSSGDAVTFDPQATLPPAIDSNPITRLACSSSTQCTAIDVWIDHSGVCSTLGCPSARAVTFNPSDPGVPSPVVIDEDTSSRYGVSVNALACPSKTQCTVLDVDDVGIGPSPERQLTFNPQAATMPTPVAVGESSSISCPASDQCTAVGGGGTEDTFNPTASSAPAPVTIDSSGTLGDVVCPSISQCTALDGASAVTFDPNAPSGLTRVSFPTFNAIGLSCPTTNQCTIWAGAQEVTFDPTSSATPHRPVTIDPTLGDGTMELVCPSSSECVVEDSVSGARVFTFDPSDPVPSLPGVIDGRSLVGLSCVSAQFCVGVDSQQGVVTFDPASLPEVPVALQPGPGLMSVACTAATFCTAVDDDGYEVTFNPATPTGSQPVAIDGNSLLTALACTGESVCVAVDNVGHEVTFDPSSPTEPTGPTQTEIDYRSGVSIKLTGVACATVSLCAATDVDGNVLTFAPAAASSAVTRAIDPGYALADVACPSAGQCTAVDNSGRALTFDPASSAQPTSATIDPGQALTAISCSSPNSCVATDAGGGLVSFDPTSTDSATRTVVDAGRALLAISCPTSSFCLAVDDAGHEVDGNPAQPSTLALEPTGDSTPLESVACTAAAQCLVVDLAGDLLLGSPAPPPPAGHGRVGAPTISGATLTLSHSGHVVLHFAVHAGTAAPPLSSLRIALPSGLAYRRLTHVCRRNGRVKRCSAAVKGLTVGGGALSGSKLVHGRLTITLSSPTRNASVTAASPLVRMLPTFAAAVSRRKGKRRTITLVLTVRVTDSDHQTTSLTASFKRQVRRP